MRHHDRKLAAAYYYGTNNTKGHRMHTHRAHKHGHSNLPAGVGHLQNRRNNLAPGSHRVHSHQAHVRGGSNMPYGVGIRQYRRIRWNKSNFPLLGLIGATAGAGLLGYALLSKKRSTIGWNTAAPVGNSINGSTAMSTAPVATSTGIAPIVHNRKIPIKERLISMVTRRPVITNYH